MAGGDSRFERPAGRVMAVGNPAVRTPPRTAHVTLPVVRAQAKAANQMDFHLPLVGPFDHVLIEHYSERPKQIDERPHIFSPIGIVVEEMLCEQLL